MKEETALKLLINIMFFLGSIALIATVAKAWFG